MIDAPLAFAFTAGMIATVNPCGFAMLPAYLSFFLGSGDDVDRSRPEVVARALLVGVIVSGGFLLVFGLAGAALTWASLSVAKWSQWATAFIGGALVLLGVAMLAGFELTARLPKLDRGGRERSGGSMFVFGVSYAVASISCTLPIFLSAVVGTFRRVDFVSGLAGFVAYSAGMALVLMALTLSMALARTTLVTVLRHGLRHVNRVSGALLVVAGTFVAYDSWVRIQVTQYGNLEAGNSISERVEAWSSDLAVWIDQTGGTTIGLVLAAAIAVTVAITLRHRREDGPSSTTGPPEPSEDPRPRPHAGV